MLRCYLLCRTSQSNLIGSKFDEWSNLSKVDNKKVGVKIFQGLTDGFIFDGQLKFDRLIHNQWTVEV